MAEQLPHPSVPLKAAGHLPSPDGMKEGMANASKQKMQMYFCLFPSPVGEGVER